MKRFLLVVIAIAGAGACEKPSADDCRKAIVNMQSLLLGNDTTTTNDDIESEVRRCRGGSSRKAVACAIKATSPAELKACEFMGTKSPK